MNEHLHVEHLNLTQVEQCRNLIDIVAERVSLAKPHDKTSALVNAARLAIHELQQEIGRVA